MKIIEMTPEQRKAHIKNLDAEIKQEEISIIKILMQDFVTYSKEGKEMAMKIVKKLHA